MSQLGLEKQVDEKWASEYLQGAPLMDTNYRQHFSSTQEVNLVKGIYYTRYNIILRINIE